VIRRAYLTSTLTEVTINVVPLGSLLRWLSSTAGYGPGNEAQISLSDIAHHQRVLSNGCYPFLSGRSKNLSVLLSKPFDFNQGRHSNCKPLCLYSLPEPHDSVRRPFVGLDGRGPLTHSSIRVGSTGHVRLDADSISRTSMSSGLPFIKTTSCLFYDGTVLVLRDPCTTSYVTGDLLPA
jgi:hypothetical protein